jgi:hypothetical protein
MLQKIFYMVCLEQRKTNQQKIHTPKITGIHQKYPHCQPATETHPTAHPAAHPTTHPHKPTTTSASHPTTGKTTYTGTPTPITSNPPAHLHPSPATQNWQKSNPNRRSGKKKKKKTKPKFVAHPSVDQHVDGLSLVNSLRYGVVVSHVRYEHRHVDPRGETEPASLPPAWKWTKLGSRLAHRPMRPSEPGLDRSHSICR